MECYWCHKQIERWFYKYEGKIFCDCNDGQCLKNYLFEKNDAYIDLDWICDDEYDMSHVDDDLDFGEE